MKILSWNCQGLAKPKAIRALRLLLSSSKPDILFLCEIKTPSFTSISNALSVFSLTNFVSVPPIGFAGGLCLAWNSNISLTVTLQKNFTINALISPDHSTTDVWQLSTIYCPSNPVGKPHFWELLSTIASAFDGPWLMIGDFNSIISQTEKIGGIPFASSSNHNFQNDLNGIGMIDLGFSGYAYTWNNKRSGCANIKQRLDRAVANSNWCTLFPNPNVSHITANSSYHGPITLNTCLTATNGSKPFKFEAMWLQDDSCFDTVHNAWNYFVKGSPHYQISSRIRNVRSALKDCNHSHFGNLHSNIKLISNEISCLQQNTHTLSSIEQERNLQSHLDDWLKKSEIFWKQKSRDNWFSEGDANTKFFHITTIFHCRSNRIIFVRNSLNTLVFEWDDIGDSFLKYYENLFKTDSPHFPPNLNNLFSHDISDDDNRTISSIPSPSEIRKTLFSFASHKSPGPDGLPPLFFKSFWKTTRDALISVVQHFFKHGFLLKSLNPTFITLIPKSNKACQVDQYRPISLCNVTYKIISKIIANRLKPFLPLIISPFQMAFVPGRNIHDNNIISHEIMDYMHKKKGRNGFMAIKVDS